MLVLVLVLAGLMACSDGITRGDPSSFLTSLRLSLSLVGNDEGLHVHVHVVDFDTMSAVALPVATEVSALASCRCPHKLKTDDAPHLPHDVPPAFKGYGAVATVNPLRDLPSLRKMHYVSGAFNSYVCTSLVSQ